MWLGWQDAYLAYTKPGTNAQHWEKQRLEVQICNPYTEEMEAEGSVPEVQGHPQLHTEYKDSLFQPNCFIGENIILRDH